MITADITNTIITNVTVTDIDIPTIAPADKSSFKSLTVLLLLFANKSKKACDTFSEVKLNDSSGLNSKVM